MSDYTITFFDEHWVGAVVALHRAVLGYSLNALLGPAHLAAVYRITAAMPSACVRVAVEGEDLLGAVSATLDEERCAREILRMLPLSQKLSMAAQLSVRPACWRALMAARRASKPVVINGQAVRACLTSIVVDPAHHGKGIGRALVEAVEEFMRQHGVKVYRLDTRASNTGARAFYARLGFVEHEQRGCDIILVKTL
ncbi:MAG: GNAT family N-acetyltransferase [bacterium]|nr:GNAT family N-acetyltransferase [bacterium]